jgi:hypothetical protein
MTASSPDQLLERAYQLTDTDPDQAMALFRQLRDRAAKAAAAELEADAEIGIGVLLYRGEGSERDSVAHFRRAIQLIPGTRSPPPRGCT